MLLDAWFSIFREASDGSVVVATSPTSGDNGVTTKDLGFLMKEVVTNDGKLRTVISV